MRTLRATGLAAVHGLKPIADFANTGMNHRIQVVISVLNQKSTNEDQKTAQIVFV